MEKYLIFAIFSSLVISTKVFAASVPVTKCDLGSSGGLVSISSDTVKNDYSGTWDVPGQGSTDYSPVAYQRVEQADVIKDSDLSGLAKMAGVDINNVTYAETFVLEETHDGQLALAIFRGQKSLILGQAMIVAWSVVVCK